MAADIPSFSKLIPGFDFLQELAKGTGMAIPGMPVSGAGADGAAPAMPGFGQWVAPTLNPDELAKRIEELKTVQFWLEQNARLLGATIQALEVQRMTLSTLKTMNVQMGDLRESMMAQVPEALKPKPVGAGGKASEAPVDKSSGPEAAADKPAGAAVDPMQWWNALTQQFTQLATTALKDAPAEAAKRMAQVDLSAFQVPGIVKTTATAPKTAAAKPAAKKAAKTASRTSKR